MMLSQTARFTFLCVTGCALLVGAGCLGHNVRALAHLSTLCKGVKDLLAALILSEVGLIVAWAYAAYTQRRSARHAYSAAVFSGTGTINAECADNDDDDDDPLLDLDGVSGGGVGGEDPTEATRSSGRGCGRCGRYLARGCVLLFSVGFLTNLWVFGQIVAEQQSGLAMPTTVAGLGGLSPAQISIEPNGMIHINASTLHDAFYAQGLVTARFRLWQMEFQRRVGSGTLAAAVGNGAVNTDKLMRTLGVYAAANASAHALSPGGQAKLQSYADGVNAYLGSKPTLPIEFRLLGVTPLPWKPADSIVWAKLMALSLSGNMAAELQRFALITERGSSLRKVAELMPPFDTAMFPTILQPADVCPDGPAAGANYSQYCDNSKAADWLQPLRRRRSSSAGRLSEGEQQKHFISRRMDEGGAYTAASSASPQRNARTVHVVILRIARGF